MSLVLLSISVILVSVLYAYVNRMLLKEYRKTNEIYLGVIIVKMAATYVFLVMLLAIEVYKVVVLRGLV